jgi:hypothetical protein
LRDTGATTVLVRKGLIKHDKISDKTVKLTFADGHSIHVPTATIDVLCPYYRGQTEAVCVDNLPFDVLIGNIPGAACACSTHPVDTSNAEDTVCLVQTRAQIKFDMLPEKETDACNKQIEFNLDTLNTQELIALQKVDLKLRTFFDRVNVITPDYPKFVIKNGVLTKLTAVGKTSRNILQQIILPG